MQAWAAHLGIILSVILTGFLGYCLSPPPGNGSPIWLPAGIGAMVMLLGNRSHRIAWIIGSGIEVVIHSILTEQPIDSRTIALIWMVFVHIVLQSYLAGWLVRKLVGFPRPLVNQWEIATFLLIVGPLSCLTSSTLNVTLLTLGGELPWSAFLNTWLTWWVGDTVGVLTVSCIALPIWGEPREIWRPRLRVIVMPLLLTFSGIVLLFVKLTWDDQQRLSDRVSRISDGIANSVVDRCREQLAGVWDWQDEVDRYLRNPRLDLMESQSQILTNHPSLDGLALLRMVPARERKSYELPDPLMNDQNKQPILDWDANQSPIPAANRNRHLVLEVWETRSGMSLPLGLDFAAFPLVESALMAHTDPTQLVGIPLQWLLPSAQEDELLIVVPVGQPVREDQPEFPFYAMGLFQLQPLLQTAQEAVRILDSQSTVEMRFSLRSPGQLPAPARVQRWTNREVISEIPLRQIDCPGVLEIRMPLDSFRRPRDASANLVILMGMVIIGLVTFQLLVMTGETVMISSEVHERNLELQQEIADRQRTEQSLRESEERLQMVLISSGLGTWDWNLDADTQLWSSLQSQIMGMPPDENVISYDQFMERVHPEDRDQVNDALQIAVNSQSRYFQQYRIIRPDGEVRWVDSQGAYLPASADHPARIMGVMEDITDRKIAAEMRFRFDQNIRETQKLESLGVMAGGIAHDFNNLLTTMLGYANLIRADLPKHSPLLEWLEEIEKSANRAADLCKQMLAYAGKGRYEVGPRDLSKLVRESVQLLRLSISKQANLTLNLASGIPAIQADPNQLRQVVMNLVMNASDALGDRAGEIQITTKLAMIRQDDLHQMVLGELRYPGAYVQLEVRDNGCGMDAETRAKIFEPFFTTKFTGRGLGLAAVVGILRAHGGAMEVQSTPGEGTTFRLIFPPSERTALPPSPAPSIAPPPAATPVSGCLLLAEDEESIRKLASLVTKSLGWEVLEASDGDEAMTLFDANQDRVRVVLLDLLMPQRNGREVYDLIRARFPRLPILMMSGYTELEFDEYFITDPCTGFLQKPFTRATLAHQLTQVLQSAASDQYDGAIEPESRS
ncbi:ATP-binding protein [Tuwongella immobilis]|uniref:histidine kinase n=1 Tax=Tuwongella immobilis TaxID=692036 RepID=A0A6C2YJX7_9BACT|nr:ATP-binding protein [Tuwongella immobilis]VIP01878.1 pas pac sensor hybrid histidine kinase : Multi-sensor hybrid histidine kinase OS=Chthoniobacter flavus Ellin428 GN=CfE428DRAFT_1844 PE=4 SV=1: MASE1: PAS_3: HisKA: HATPase_c: Response_reg [Tuwongella immobilis]VTR99722.1 pas pac sensor hybrid histidine kinase : Multi-sensor hybrid histidine kinase OS=Chthoniobacter flavus Ellin428 GN=CfE428DRAFT_1844 PE=4 SV=1: MASE1: PAS_3: HisKA: HATPase_c: Response_reg [Tuwongella immobilis]